MATKKSKRGRKSDPQSKSGQIRELLAAGMKPMDIARKIGCTPPLVYNVKARMEGGATKAAPKRAWVGRPAMASASGLGDFGGILAAVQRSEQDR